MDTIMSFCKFCNTDLSSLSVKLVACHYRWCKSKPQKQISYHLKCSCIVCKREITAQGIKQHYDSHNKIYTNKCKNCSELISKSKEFCSKSCSATFNNTARLVTQETKNKISMSLKIRAELTGKPNYTKVSQCAICSSYFKTTTGLAKSCSSQCKSILLSQSIKSAIYNGKYNPQNNRGRGNQSYLEKSFQQWLSQNFPLLEVITEMKFKRNDMIKTYYADFYFPSKNLIIELDGSQHKLTTEYDSIRDAYISANYNLTILRISHDDYVKKTYIDYIKDILS